MSKVVITLEFPNIFAAAGALSQLLPPQPIAAVELPTNTVLFGDDPQSLPSAPAVEKTMRKPRADAGKPRGPHKTTGEPAASEPGAGAVNSVAVSTPAAPATPTQSTAPATVGATAPDPSAKLTKEDAREALGRINKTAGLGMPACMEHLKQFGVNRISVLPEKDFALFIKQADEKIAEHLAAAKK